MKPRPVLNPAVDWKKALGATYNVPVHNAAILTPIDLLALRGEVLFRIRSTGGRPTDQTWTIERQVPFREEVWQALQEISLRLRNTGASASPAQIAALLIEQGVKALTHQRGSRSKKVSPSQSA